MFETILEIVITVLFIWLFFKALKLTFKITWGVTKIIAIILFAVACPVLIVCLLLASGVVLLLPLMLIAVALALVKKQAIKT